MIRFYKRYVAQSIWVGLPALLAMAVALLMGQTASPSIALAQPDSPLWDGLLRSAEVQLPLSPYWGVAMVLMASCLLSYATWHYAVIRERSFLPFAFGVLFLGVSPLSGGFHLSDVAMLVGLFAVCVGLQLFRHPYPQSRLFFMGTVFGISTLMDSEVLFFVPLVLSALPFYRCMSLKGVFAFLLGVAFVLWVGLCAALLSGWHELFFEHFVPLADIDLPDFNAFETWRWVYLVVFLVLFGCSFLSFQMLLYLDKIRTRAQLNFLFLLSVLLFVVGFFIPAQRLAFQLSTACLVIPVSHFFAFAESKSKIIFFYILLALYLVFCFASIYFLQENV